MGSKQKSGQKQVFTCLQFFPFAKPGIKNGKVCPSNGSYINQYDLFSAGFWWGFLYVCKTIQNLNAA